MDKTKAKSGIADTDTEENSAVRNKGLRFALKPNFEGLFAEKKSKRTNHIYNPL